MNPDGSIRHEGTSGVWVAGVLIALVRSGSPGICSAEEKVVNPPGGWTFDPAGGTYALLSDAIAVACYQGEPPYSTSRVTQYSGLSGSAISAQHTDLPGKIFALEYAPSGEFLLVHSALPGDGKDGR